jgi:RNA polymerase sigma factor (sigma-70 family)
MSVSDDPDRLSDDALVERFRVSGGDRYFKEIFERHGKPILGVCRRILGNDSLAEDLVQETFKRAFTEIHRFRGGNLRGWLFTIARRLCINYLRSKFAREVPSLADPDTLAFTGSAEHDLLTKAEILAVLNNLPVEQRVCLKLLYIEGLSYEEISAATGYSPAEVKTYIQNGKRRFKILWEKQKGTSEA